MSILAIFVIMKLQILTGKRYVLKKIKVPTIPLHFYNWSPMAEGIYLPIFPGLRGPYSLTQSGEVQSALKPNRI